MTEKQYTFVEWVNHVDELRKKEDDSLKQAQEADERVQRIVEGYEQRINLLFWWRNFWFSACVGTWVTLFVLAIYFIFMR